MPLASDKLDSLIRFTSRLADELNGLKADEHRALAAQMLKGIGKRCDLAHVHLYLTRLKDGPQISLYGEWSREMTPSLVSRFAAGRFAAGGRKGSGVAFVRNSGVLHHEWPV